MPRYRKLHTKTVYSLDVNDMPDDFTRLFWVLMPVGLSREGTSHDHPAYIKSRIFPLRDDVTYKMIGAALDWFAEHGMIQRYQVDKRLYFHQVNFAKYQGNTSKEAESDFPPVPDVVTHNSRPTPEPVKSKSVTDAVCSMQYANSQVVVDSVTPESRETHDDENDDDDHLPTGITSQISQAWGMARGGLVNSLDSQRLTEMESEYGAQEVLDAIHEANSSRTQGRSINLNYAEAFLKRWAQEGRDTPFDPNKAITEQELAAKAEKTQHALDDFNAAAIRKHEQQEREDKAWREQQATQQVSASADVQAKPS